MHSSGSDQLIRGSSHRSSIYGLDTAGATQIYSESGVSDRRHQIPHRARVCNSAMISSIMAERERNARISISRAGLADDKVQSVRGIIPVAYEFPLL